MGETANLNSQGNTRLSGGGKEAPILRTLFPSPRLSLGSAHAKANTICYHTGWGIKAPRKEMVPFMDRGDCFQS